MAKEKQKTNNERQNAHIPTDSDLTGMANDIVNCNQARADHPGAIFMPEGTSPEVAGHCVNFIKQYNEARRPDKYSNQQ